MSYKIEKYMCIYEGPLGSWLALTMQLERLFTRNNC